MMRRILRWRMTPAGIWAEWFAFVAALLTLTIASIAFDWHWLISGALALLTAFFAALIALLLSIRNDMGERDRSAPQLDGWVFRSRQGDVRDTAAAMIPPDTEE